MGDFKKGFFRAIGGQFGVFAFGLVMAAISKYLGVDVKDKKES